MSSAQKPILGAASLDAKPIHPKTLRPLPEMTRLLELNVEPLAGQVIPQFIRCGQLSCHCNDGARHGPYFYRVWREAGTVQKVYVKRKDAAAIRLQTQVYEAVQHEFRRLASLRESSRKRINAQRLVLRRETFGLRRSKEVSVQSVPARSSKLTRSQAAQARRLREEEVLRSQALRVTAQTTLQLTETVLLRAEALVLRAETLASDAQRIIENSRRLREQIALDRKQRAEERAQWARDR